MHRLLVLPHAGGAAHGYLPLRQALEPAVPVLCHELPGRGKRSREAKVKNLNSAVDDILQASAELRQGTWSVFGHSMGALLAHALVRRLLELGQALPQGIYASGTVAPSARQRKSISQLPRDDFWREIRAYGGVPAEILAVPDFMDYFEESCATTSACWRKHCPHPRPYPCQLRYFMARMR
ncbi:thioesterase II family protein [Pseudoroseomonas wenyumeiae]